MIHGAWIHALWPSIGSVPLLKRQSHLITWRFLLAMIAIMDAIDRIPDLRAHYSDEGYVPRHLVLSKMSLPAYVSLHMANGSYQFAFLLFVVQVSVLRLGIPRFSPNADRDRRVSAAGMAHSPHDICTSTCRSSTHNYGTTCGSYRFDRSRGT